MRKALGVNIDVSLMHQGRVLIDNIEARKRELGHFIGKIVETRELSPADALKLRARMQFTAASGRAVWKSWQVAKTCLAKVTNAYRSGSNDASDSWCRHLCFSKLSCWHKGQD